MVFGGVALLSPPCRTGGGRREVVLPIPLRTEDPNTAAQALVSPGHGVAYLCTGVPIRVCPADGAEELRTAAGDGPVLPFTASGVARA